MQTQVTNLQNTPDPKGVTREAVSFQREGNTLRGLLFLPSTATAPFPAVVVTGAWTTVKEQMAGTYARALAQQGFAALVFDFTGWGQSGGSPRFVEDPAVKTADIKAAAEFLASLEVVNSDAISGLGVCASSGYMASAVADHPGFSKLALVAPWLHDPAMAEGIYGGKETVADLIATSREAGENTRALTAASTEDDTAPMYMAPYYTETDRGLIAEYDNKFSPRSWEPWLLYDAQASADRLNKPTLIVGSPSIALPDGATAYETRTKAPVEKLWLEKDVSQFDFYDRTDVVSRAAETVAAFLLR